MLNLSDAFATFPVLETERLVLRALAPDDVDDFFSLYSDPQVMRFFGRAPITTRDEAQQRVEGTITAFRERTGIRWAITRRGTPPLIGSCGFWRLVPEHHRAEVGYELAPGCWGQGIMPEALAAILTWGFARLGLHSVEAQIAPENHGSRRVLEKLGFVQEGYFRENFYEDGQFTDTAVFSLLAGNWRAEELGN